MSIDNCKYYLIKIYLQKICSFYCRGVESTLPFNGLQFLMFGPKVLHLDMYQTQI